MKKIKILIVILVIIIAIIGIVLITISNSKGKIGNEVLDPEYVDEVILANTLQNLDIKNEYFTVKKCVNSYYDNIIGMYADYDESEKKENIEYYQNALYNVLGKEYIQEFGIKVNSLYNQYKKMNKSKLILNDIKYYDISEKVTLYLAEGYNVSYENYNKVQVRLMVIVDYNNRSYSIYPWEYVEKHKLNEYKVGDKINFSIEEIEKNEYNTFVYKNYLNEDMAKEYFDLYKFKMLNLTEEAYNELDEEYATKRFGNISNYKNYIKDRYSEIYISAIKTYNTDENKDYTEYVCKDQYDNLYIFKETSIMDYTVTLDTYTIEQAKFVAEYAKANNQKKVMMNIDKFFQMINAKDYTAAYNCLADSFKNNYFKTEASFEQYVKTNLYRYNTVTYKTYTDEVAGIHQYKLTITNKQNANSSKQFNIVMKLNSGTDFEMSFEV